jgi:hypothetical protein
LEIHHIQISIILEFHKIDEYPFFTVNAIPKKGHSPMACPVLDSGAPPFHDAWPRCRSIPSVFVKTSQKNMGEMAEIH